MNDCKLSGLDYRSPNRNVASQVAAVNRVVWEELEGVWRRGSTLVSHKATRKGGASPDFWNNPQVLCNRCR